MTAVGLSASGLGAGRADIALAGICLYVCRGAGGAYAQLPPGFERHGAASTRPRAGGDKRWPGSG
jgi:hypothetical protein